MRSIVKELVARDGKRKVQIFRREDGSFGFEALQYSEEPLELCWIPYGRFSECYAADEQTAEYEARGRVDWLRQNEMAAKDCFDRSAPTVLISRWLLPYEATP